MATISLKNSPNSMKDTPQLALWPIQKQALISSGLSSKTPAIFSNEANRIAERLKALTHSMFRMSWHLKLKQIQYIHEKGIDTITRHANELIANRLAPAYIPNDGKQTPMKGHPVFIAQHATGTCCRSCLQKWHHIPPGTAFTPAQQHYVTTLIMTWITRQLNHWQSSHHKSPALIKKNSTHTLKKNTNYNPVSVDTDDLFV